MQAAIVPHTLGSVGGDRTTVIANRGCGGTTLAGGRERLTGRPDRTAQQYDVFHNEAGGIAREQSGRCKQERNGREEHDDAKRASCGRYARSPRPRRDCDLTPMASSFTPAALRRDDLAQ